MKSGLGFVAAVNLIIWAGITLYLFILDRRLKKLEQMCEEQRSEVRGQRSEDRGQRSEVRGQRSEVRKSEGQKIRRLED